MTVVLDLAEAPVNSTEREIEEVIRIFDPGRARGIAGTSVGGGARLKPVKVHPDERLKKPYHRTGHRAAALMIRSPSGSGMRACHIPNPKSLTITPRCASRNAPSPPLVPVPRGRAAAHASSSWRDSRPRASKARAVSLVICAVRACRMA